MAATMLSGLPFSKGTKTVSSSLLRTLGSVSGDAHTCVLQETSQESWDAVLWRNTFMVLRPDSAQDHKEHNIGSWDQSLTINKCHTFVSMHMPSSQACAVYRYIYCQALCPHQVSQMFQVVCEFNLVVVHE